MLDILLDDYLARLPNERLFDAPFGALLPALGFYDVHYTHGAGEFGKDFIAKKREARRVVQFSFQLKRHVSQSEGREIESQLLQAITSPRTHPNFDAKKPHQPVLVITDRLTGNTALSFANINEQIEQKFNALPLQIWGRERLARDLERHALSGMYRATVQGVRSYSESYALFGQAMEGSITPRAIERFGRSWLDTPPDPARQNINTSQLKEQPEGRPSTSSAPSTSRATATASSTRLLSAAVEASLLARRCHDSGAFYEEVVCELALWRAVLHTWHRAQEDRNDALGQHCRLLHERARASVVQVLDAYIKHVTQLWHSASGDLICCLGTQNRNSGVAVLTYPVECLRFVELLGLRFFLSAEPRERSRLAKLLADFVQKEPGCAHPISERFAASLVWPILALGLAGHRDVALNWVREAAVWLGDRHEKGQGLARLESSAEEEAAVLLASGFSFFSERNSASLLACVLADIAAWLGESQLYADIVNDWASIRLCPNYFQAADTEGAFRFEAPDVVQHPRVTYDVACSSWPQRNFASHIHHEPRSYALNEICGISAFAAVSLLLRDRYFPGLWPQPPEHSRTTSHSVAE